MMTFSSYCMVIPQSPIPSITTRRGGASILKMGKSVKRFPMKGRSKQLPQLLIPMAFQNLLEEKDRQNNECFIPHHTSRCFFLTPDKHRMKSCAVPIYSNKTQSSLSTITRAQTLSKGLTANEQRVGKSYSGATTTKSLLPNNPQATQKIKSYAVATKHAQTASPPTSVQVSCSSGKSNSNGRGKGKKTAHRTGSNQHQTYSKTNATPKSSGKKWPRPPRKQ